MTFQFEDTRPLITDDDIVDDLQRVAASLKSPTLKKRDYERLGRLIPQ